MHLKDAFERRVGKRAASGVSGRYAAVLQQVAPGCVGDGDVVFERFGDGLVGAAGPGGDTCAACEETIGGVESRSPERRHGSDRDAAVQEVSRTLTSCRVDDHPS